MIFAVRCFSIATISILQEVGCVKVVYLRREVFMSCRRSGHWLHMVIWMEEFVSFSFDLFIIIIGEAGLIIRK